MSTKTDLRQTKYVGSIDQLTTTQTTEGDNIVKSVNDDLTALLRLSANNPASLIVNIGAGELLNAESNRRRAIPHVGSAYVQFASGTVTFPASSGGNIVSSPGGGTTVLTVSSGNYVAVLVYLDGSGNINTIAGTEAASEAAAITNLPPAPSDTIAPGFIVVRNVGGVIQNIAQNNIRQFSIGTGGGSGTGNELLETLKNQFIDGTYDLLTPYIVAVDEDDLRDNSSTATYSLIDKSINFTNSNTQFVTKQLADQIEFLNNTNALESAELTVFWKENFVSTNAVYELSRDGGTNWQTVTMERVGSTEVFRGIKTFSNETVDQTLFVNPFGTGLLGLNSTNNTEISQPFTVAANSKLLLKKLRVDIQKTGTPQGNIFISICADNAGSPGTVLAETNAILISGLANGDNTLNLPNLYLNAGTYHIKIRSDATYRATHVGNAVQFRVSVGTVVPIYLLTFNGTVWTSQAGTQTALEYTVFGLSVDLRARITTSQTVKLDGLGVFYDKSVGNISAGAAEREVFHFSGDANQSTFTITNFVPNPDLLKVYDVKTGQVYVFGAFSISGQQVLFDAGQFNVPGQLLTLVFDQTVGGAFDNSDSNGQLLSENRLGSKSGALDKSVAGEGFLLRADNGKLVECYLSWNGTSYEWQFSEEP